MFRIPAQSRNVQTDLWKRYSSSSSFIRNTFLEYFIKDHGHKHIQSSSVVPLSDPTVPFVNAGMNQFKGVFLGTLEAPCPRAVNSQKCVRVGGKHNDLEVVGVDGHHHTFFEMLGNWSFGDYYKKEACEMAWNLLLGPYQMKPEQLVITYFSGDAVLGLPEDKECREIWKDIGVPASRLKDKGAPDNFWEMGASGPCGPSTEIHYVNHDGSLTEIWNIVFIQCHRQSNGKVNALRNQYIDTGLGLERLATILQKVPSNYDTDLFVPILKAIEKNGKASPYTGSYNKENELDIAYRKLADHARMISVCLADSVFPASNLNLKQVMRKSFKLSSDVFGNPQLLHILYDHVMATLGDAYPELVENEKQAKLILEHEQQAYARLRTSLSKKWRDLAQRYPEVEKMTDVEAAGFPLGYTEFKETMSKQNSTMIPGELIFKLYDTHGFQEELIDRIAKLNNLELDRKGFWSLLTKHRTRHKTSMKEQSNNKGILFEKAVEEILKTGVKSTDDSYKYSHKVENNKITFEPLKTKLLAILNQDCEWVDFLDPCENDPYYLVTKETNFYCEEGGQTFDTGVIRVNNNTLFEVDSVFKIRDFVFHKGQFKIKNNDQTTKNYCNCDSDVELMVDSERRLKLMHNHTAIHLLNAAIRKVLPNSVVCQTGSSVTDKGISLNLSVYGEKLSQEVVKNAQELIRRSIQADVPVNTRVIDSVQLSQEANVTKIPGERYPEKGLRLVTIEGPVVSRELCCGTHLPSTGHIQEFCVTLVKGAGGNSPVVHALTAGHAKEAQELFCRAEKLAEVIHLTDPERCEEEASFVRQQLTQLCGAGGAPYGEYADCLALLDGLKKKSAKGEVALNAIAEAEIAESISSAIEQDRKFVVQFLRCSYLMSGEAVRTALRVDSGSMPALRMGCAAGIIHCAAIVPREHVTESFTAERWLRCILPVFHATVLKQDGRSLAEFSEMSPSKVSLINCEQQVHDAMRAAIKFAQAQLKDSSARSHGEQDTPSKNRQQN